MDLQRVLADQPIRIHLPIHFLNAATSPGVKVQGGIVSHLKSDVEIVCLPKDLPESLAVDMGKMALNETLFLKDIPLPAGVTIPELTKGRDIPVVSIHSPRAEEAGAGGCGSRGGCCNGDACCCGLRMPRRKALLLPLPTPRKSRPRRTPARSKRRPAEMPGLAIKLIVGLGNPGRDYESSRHNAGFWLVEELARRHGGAFRLEPKFNAELARIRIGGHELWLVKPQDYMNNSGRVTAAVATFYKIEPAQLLVVHDELDLPPGEVRLKEGGGAGGHNGLKDLIAHLGDGLLAPATGRRASRHRESGDALAAVAQLCGRARRSWNQAVRAAADIVPFVIEQGAAAAMQKLHSRAAPPKD